MKKLFLAIVLCGFFSGFAGVANAQWGPPMTTFPTHPHHHVHWNHGPGWHNTHHRHHWHHHHHHRRGPVIAPQININRHHHHHRRRW